VNASRPEDAGDSGSVRDDAWIGFVDAFTSPVIVVRGICAGGNVAAKLSFRTKVGSTPVNGTGKSTVKCPGASRVTGGGVTNPASYGNAAMTSSFPADTGDRDRGYMSSRATGPPPARRRPAAPPARVRAAWSVAASRREAPTRP
jgi:hypothetical protein